MKGDRPLSLNVKLLMVQLSSLCLALAIFLAGMLAGRWWLNRFYLSEEASGQRKLDYVRALNSYVQENALSSTSAKELEDWTRQQKYVYLVLYQGGTAILETDGYETDQTEKRVYNNLLPAVNHQAVTDLEPDEEGRFRLQFRDGIFQVSLVEFSETPYYDLVVISSLAAACAALLAVNLLYHRKVTLAIIRLSREVQRVERGTQTKAIRSDRRDEIGRLAQAVEQMRQSIIQRMESERDAWSANGELITAISHDIRTPLTALMGYLDLLADRQYQTEDQMERYLQSSREKAVQLKELTDELFQYFLVFATPEMQMDPVCYDGVILMEQLLGEQIIRLQESGFLVQSVSQQQACWVKIDVQYLRRALDNVFSNVQKYADREQKVAVMTRLGESMLKIYVANAIPDQPNQAESTKIGLQTCRKILREMGGGFEARQAEGKFITELSLPVTEPPNALEEGDSDAE